MKHQSFSATATRVISIVAAMLFATGVVWAQGRTLVVAAPGTPEGLDGDVLKPGTQESVVQVYEGLTRYGRIQRDGRTFLDPNKIEGHLAESWTVSADGKSYVFKLRPGIKSHFGNELTADDVTWSWQKSLAQKRTGNFIARVSNVTDVKTKSKYEVEFILSAPSMILLNTLTLYVPGIYDSTEAKKHVASDDPWALKWIERNTAGFGAYHMESNKSNEQAVFVANKNYFGSKPHFDRVIYRAVPSGANRVLLLKTGQVHFIDRPTVQQVIELKKDAKVKVEDHFGRAIASLRMNVALKPFDDVRVRRAFNYAVDKDAIRKAVFLGTGIDALSIVPPVVGGYDPSAYLYKHNPALAKKLLGEAGYGNGLDVELLWSGIWWWEEAMAVQVADQLGKIGVNVKLTKITGSDMRSRGAPGKQDMPFFAFEDGPIVLDPVYSMYLLARSDGVSNRGKYANPKMDQLIDEARSSLDANKRLDLMKQAQKIWMDDAPWILTTYPTTFEAMSPRVSGWVPHPDEHERWSDLTMK